MSSDIFLKLGERLNKNFVRLPLIEPVLDFLKEVYTAEQAALGAEFPMGANTLRDLAKQLNRDETELEILIEAMADEGLIFVAKNKNNENEYSLTPFLPGIVEMQTIKGEETEKVRKRARLLMKVHEALDAITKDSYENPDIPKESIAFPGLRTLAVEEKLPTDTTIATYEQLTDIINKEDSFAVGACACRQEAKLNNHPCKVTDAAKFSCIYFGKVADYMTDRNLAKKFSRNEVMSLLKDCEKVGLVHNINNFIGNNIVLCNCCGCCCEHMIIMKKYRGITRISGSNFVASVNNDNCIECGDCVDVCQMEAIQLEEGILAINQNHCIGCGNCASICPVDSLYLVRCSEVKPQEMPAEIVGLGL